VALKLMGMGYSSVYALKGGWIEWEEAKYPIEKK
jgi:3-mercaptopyruvate sulfurtransferase SseA